MLYDAITLSCRVVSGPIFLIRYPSPVFLKEQHQRPVFLFCVNGCWKSFNCRTRERERIKWDYYLYIAWYVMGKTLIWFLEVASWTVVTFSGFHVKPSSGVAPTNATLFVYDIQRCRTLDPDWSEGVWIFLAARFVIAFLLIRYRFAVTWRPNTTTYPGGRFAETDI